jgi:5,6-dimethylbenzimidazole synthase
LTKPAVFDASFRETLHELLVWRRDVRRFKPDPLPPGTLERLVSVAALAPSVGLSEPWRFVSVTSPARRAAVRASFEVCNAEALRHQADDKASLYARLKLAGLDDAPIQFAVFADMDTAQGHGLGRRTMPETLTYSAVMAVHTLWLAARAEDIGLGWVSILDPATVTAALDVSPTWQFIGYFCMGFPMEITDTPTLAQDGWEQRTDPAAFLIER